MINLSLNIVICHDCEYRQQECKGKCICSINNESIIENAKNNYCPKDKFTPVSEQPKPTIEDVGNFLIAQLNAKRVSLDIVEERIQTCQRCPYQSITKDGIKFCNIGCGCSLKPKRKRLIKAVTEVEENLPNWGCKHPDRSVGGWKR